MLVKPTIRYFNKNDLGGIMGIERQSFSNPWSQNMFEALFQINPEGFYVAFIDDVLVGYAIVLTEISWRHWSRNRTAHLMNLAVDPRFRNQGIGKRLIDRIISDIKRIEAEEIYLEVRASNTKALAFYKKLGFDRIGVIERFYGDEDAIVMAKKIS
jgi:ribosomal-protein-alanine N-acetyltransferase